jgi:hypothetical protein
MSGRFTRQQRRKRWADTGIVFPKEYVASVNHLSCSKHESIAAFAAQLQEFTALSSTYNEIVKFKSIAALLLKAARELENIVRLFIRLSSWSLSRESSSIASV